jgi:predicted transcriptional regulator
MSKRASEIRLGRLELQIMVVVWDKGRATVHDVKEALSQGRKPAYSTILTMMRKLEAKGYLVHAVQDRTYVYRATISRHDVRQSLLGDARTRLRLARCC